MTVVEPGLLLPVRDLVVLLGRGEVGRDHRRAEALGSELRDICQS